NVQNQQGATNYITNSTIWAYDITGDAGSLDANGAPKLLMSSSIGKTTTGVSTFGLPSGLGSAGDYLGVIWRLAGMKILSAPNWRQAFTNEAAAQGITEAQLARFSRKYQGYYPGNGSVVATNDISHQHGVMPVYPWIGHAVISGDDEGKPVAFASLGLNGKLVTIDTKLGSDEAIVAYEGAPMADWDDRVQDLGATVDNERVLRVETPDEM
ncbi:MAG: hypothetical protein Q8K67_08920, partial [Geothrix sp.]|nr:hypothetical protein [Geothrix sp.]